MMRFSGLRRFFATDRRAVQNMPDLYRFPGLPPAINRMANQSLSKYMGGDYLMLNAALRENIPLTKEQKGIVRGVDRALSSLPNYKNEVYRQVNFPNEGMKSDYLKRHSPGSVVEYSSYTSTTKNPQTIFEPNSGQIVIKINGKTGKDISSLNLGLSEEEEVLFPRNSKFRVNSLGYSKEAGVYFGEMDEI